MTIFIKIKESKLYFKDWVATKTAWFLSTEGIFVNQIRDDTAHLPLE